MKFTGMTISCALTLLLTGGSLCHAGSITYAEKIEVAGSLKLLDGALFFADGTSMTTAVFSDGSAIWGQITGYIDNQIDLSAKFETKEDKANKNIAGGYAGLDTDGRILASVSRPSSKSYIANKTFNPEFDNIWQKNTDWLNVINISTTTSNYFSPASVSLSFTDNLGIYADNVNGTFCTIAFFQDAIELPVCVFSYTGIYGYETYNQISASCNVANISQGSHIFRVKHISDNCKYGFSPHVVTTTRQLTVRYFQE